MKTGRGSSDQRKAKATKVVNEICKIIHRTDDAPGLHVTVGPFCFEATGSEASRPVVSVVFYYT